MDGLIGHLNIFGGSTLQNNKKIFLIELGKIGLAFWLLAGVPAQADPWYYQTDSSIEFWIPDKAQHFYGSQLLVESGVSPLVVFLGGLLYESQQREFSERDLLANTLGILAAHIPLTIDYSTVDKEIMLIIVVRLR